MGKDIRKVYKECKVCLENSPSKVDKKALVIPEDFTLLAPGEQVSADFMDFSGRDYLVIKDKTTGFLEVIRTKDKSTESATKGIHTYIYTFGIPHSVKTDKGPAFRGGFISWLRGLGINQILTSAYHTKSNGL